jgi:hypothetical protein
MAERALEIAHLLLREGALRQDDREHQEVYAELSGDAALYEEVRGRLAAVGYDLKERFKHLGVRVSAEAADATPTKNRMGLDAGHIRLIVYFWTHLVYREVNNLRRELQSRPPGGEQRGLFTAPEEEEIFLSFRAVIDDFAESVARNVLLGRLRHLRRHRFIRLDEKRDRIWADASLYVLLDHERMEDFVLDLARRMGTAEPLAAVDAIATGSPVPDPDDGDEGGAP